MNPQHDHRWSVVGVQPEIPIAGGIRPSGRARRVLLSLLVVAAGVLTALNWIGWARISLVRMWLGEWLRIPSRLLSTAVTMAWPLVLLACALLVLRTFQSLAGTRLAWRVTWFFEPTYRRMSAGIIAFLVFMGLVVVFLPTQLVGDEELKFQDRPKLENDIRATLFQALGGLLLTAGAIATWRQLLITREGQVTERFTRAVEQLGNPEVDVRIGAIYALERLSLDSPSDRKQIHELLAALVRNRSLDSPALQEELRERAKRSARVRTLARWMPTFLAGKPSRKFDAIDIPLLRTRAPDVQAALTVLGRRPNAHEEFRTFDFHRVDLRRADLERANLVWSNFLGADLRNANLSHADLRGTDLNAYLDGTDLQFARLEGANLIGARLENARLGGAFLVRNTLRGANLTGANLNNAMLHGADLSMAILDGATLTGAAVNGQTRWPTGFDAVEAGVELDSDASRLDAHFALYQASLGRPISVSFNI